MSSAADDLSVSIVSMPMGPDINAAEFLSLTCQATGGTGVYTYQWSSNCTGNCFLNNINPITQTITRDALRSTDSGFYTCTVTDNAGNNGSDFTQVQVIGKFECPVVISIVKWLSQCFVYFEVLPIHNVDDYLSHNVLSLTANIHHLNLGHAYT